MADFDQSNKHTQTKNDLQFKESSGQYFDDAMGSSLDKLEAFPRFVSRQALSRFLIRQRLFNEVVKVHGHIVECGVFSGFGMFSWLQLSAIYEPYNHTRRVIGFDTFDGFPGLSDEDSPITDDPLKSEGAYAFDGLGELSQGVDLYNVNRPIGHIPRSEFVVGDAVVTIPEYVEENPHLVVALLYLDFDLYEPTKAALESLVPRMPKGAVIAFDELNQKQWPGETKALIDTFGINSLRIERSEIVPQVSWAVL